MIDKMLTTQDELLLLPTHFTHKAQTLRFKRSLLKNCLPIISLLLRSKTSWKTYQSSQKSNKLNKRYLKVLKNQDKHKEESSRC